MPNITHKRPPLAAYQIEIIDCEERYSVTEAGTKTGKTASHIVWLVEETLKLPRGKFTWWIAPIFAQAEIAFKRVKEQWRPIGSLIVNETKLTITFPNGATMQFKSAEKPDSLFGEDVYAAVFDEFTRAKEDAWFALRSTLTATNGKCKFIGNAKGKKNWGYRLGQRAKNGEPGYRYFKITAWDAVAAGFLKQEEVEQARRDLPEHIFNELYLAEPTEDGSNPFGLNEIRAQIKPISTLPAVAFGVDVGKYVDWTVITGLDTNGDVCYFDRFQKPWGDTKAYIAKVVGKTPAFVDATGVGDPLVEELTKVCPALKGFKYSSQTKQQLMESLRSSIVDGKISILAGAMQDEMEGFEYEYSEGRVKFSAPSGQHDDCVNSLALANDCKIKNPVRKFVIVRP